MPRRRANAVRVKLLPRPQERQPSPTDRDEHRPSNHDNRRDTVVSAAVAVPPRLALADRRTRDAVLDGGWWPRTQDPAAELPGLVSALSARFGPVRQMLLCGSLWDSRFRRLSVDGVVLRLGWFASMNPALLVAICDRGDQIDLLVVPPATPPEAAERAMKAAAGSENRLRAQHVLAAAELAPAPVSSQQKTAWDNEGGSIKRA